MKAKHALVGIILLAVTGASTYVVQSRQHKDETATAGVDPACDQACIKAAQKQANDQVDKADKEIFDLLTKPTQSASN